MTKEQHVERRQHRPNRLARSRVLALLVLLSALVGLSSASTRVAASEPTLTLTPDHVYCTTEVTATGTGFIPGSEVIISAGSVEDIPGTVFEAYWGFTTVADDGSFSLEVQPRPNECIGLEPDEHQLTASTVTGESVDGAFGSPTATVSYTYQPDSTDPALTLSPDHGFGCMDVTARGEHFEPGTFVSLYVGGLGGGSFSPATAEPPVVGDDGTFSVTLSSTHLTFINCGDGNSGVSGGQYIVYADTGRGSNDDPFRDPSAAWVFTVTLPPAEHFHNTWARTDKPVADDVVDRTWMWGMEPISDVFEEAYAESPSGVRQVQYYDKSRMGVTHPGSDPTSNWYVTNGLLVVEMVEGRYQIGDNAFDDSPDPADIPIAGDLDAGGLTYAQINDFDLRSRPAQPVGSLIRDTVDDAGQVRPGDIYTGDGVIAAVHVPATSHTIASPFWTFMQSSGTVWDHGEYVTGNLFENPFYATGYPITEAYWSTTLLEGQPTDILWQCFERRCLTYTPSNPEGWRVEAGNIGMHYSTWRYGGGSDPQFDLIFETLNDDVAISGTLTYEGAVMTVTIDAESVSSGEEHPVAMHGLRGDGPFYLDPWATCPTPEHDLNGDGLIEDAEAQQTYGEALLPMPPYPIAADDGTFTYEASFDINEVGSDPIGVPALRVIVVSGMTVDGVYDPTIPIACGRIIYVEASP